MYGEKTRLVDFLGTSPRRVGSWVFTGFVVDCLSVVLSHQPQVYQKDAKTGPKKKESIPIAEDVLCEMQKVRGPGQGGRVERGDCADFWFPPLLLWTQSPRTNVCPHMWHALDGLLPGQ